MYRTLIIACVCMALVSGRTRALAQLFGGGFGHGGSGHGGFGHGGFGHGGFGHGGSSFGTKSYGGFGGGFNSGHGGGVIFGFGPGGLKVKQFPGSGGGHFPGSSGGHMPGSGGGHFPGGGYRKPGPSLPSGPIYQSPPYRTPTYSPPQYSPPQYSPPQNPTPQPAPPASPPPADSTPPRQDPPAETTPRKNEMALVGRHITAEEILRAKEFFQQSLQDFARTIQRQAPATDVDLAALISQMVAASIAAEIQVRIIDLLHSGNLAAAKTYWISACPGQPVPFRESPVRIYLTSFCAKIEGGGCTIGDVRQLEREIVESGLIEDPCCGAPSLLSDIQQHVQIGQAIARAVPGQHTQSVGVPTGMVEIIYHPGLPDDSLVVVDAATVLLGTGGVGKLRTQRGTVAQALGLPIGSRSALPADDSKLIRSGILVENPTEGRCQYLIDNTSFSMEPGGSQVFTGKDSVRISFDKGNGRETMRYNIKPGTYRFANASGGWNLFRYNKFEVVVDNSNNSEPFCYIVQGKHATVEPHSSSKHASGYPIIIRYDRGNGSATKQIVFGEKHGKLEVAVNQRDNLWDLFRVTSENQPTLALPPPNAGFVPAF